jgi:SNF2 family DNA or RNA helicase
MALKSVKCSWCGKTAHEKLDKARQIVFGQEWIYLDCGHTLIRDAVKTEGFEDMVSKDGRMPREFQTKTAEFAERANLNYICAHEMGLGKTVIECLLIKRHLNELKPMLIVCKSGLRMQWWAEIYRWTGQLAYIIENSNDRPDFDMYDIFIISFDTLKNVRPVLSTEEVQLAADAERDSEVALLLGQRGRRVKSIKWTDEICCQFRHIAIDETQQIKNPGSARTASLMDLHKATGIRFNPDGTTRMESRARIGGYSGTPIKNKPSEYWTLLNMVRPEMFPFHDSFCRNFIRYSAETGKEVGLKDPEYFHQLTKDFVLRYERSEVLSELPPINRMFRLAEMGENFIEAYKRIVKEFQEFMDIQEKSPNATDLLGWFSRMRHITGVAKVNECIEFAEEFLLENDRKLVIFIHHKEVGKALMEKLSKIMKEGAWEPPLQLHSGLDMRARADVVEQFKESQNRVLIASQLAAGEGLNLQFCSDCIMMERQWNPANEEQCEARFPRIGTTASVVNVWYLIAAGTIDEFLTELVEQKRAIFQQVMDGKESNWEDANLMRDLAEALRVKGLRKFNNPKKGGKK